MTASGGLSTLGSCMRVPRTIDRPAMGRLPRGMGKLTCCRNGSDAKRLRMARLRLWLGRFIEARGAARDARLFARIVDERANRRAVAGRSVLDSPPALGSCVRAPEGK